MQTAGLTVVVDWDDAKVKKGVADLNAMFKGGLSGLSIDSSGALKGLQDANKIVQQILSTSDKIGEKAAENLQKGAKALQDAVNKGANSGSNGGGLFPAPKGNTNASVAYISQLKKEIKSLEAESLKLAYAGKQSTDAFDRVTSALNAKKSALKEAQSQVKATAGAYAALTQKANAATQKANDLGAALGVDSKEFKEASAEAKGYTDKLKAIDGASGRNFRNVGNYTGSLQGISHSLNQITREFPAFANSAQTGFMALSNNIPMVYDQIKGLVAQNKQLAASGQPTVSVLKTLSAAIFSWGTALSLAVTLLTVYGAEIWDFIRGNEAASASVEAMNEALADNSVIDAKANMAQLKEEVQLAKEGHADASTVLDHFKSVLGDAAKGVDTLGEAEQWLTKNAETFVRYQIAKAKATWAYAEAAKAATDLENLGKNYGFTDVLKDDATKLGTTLKNLGSAIWQGDFRKILNGTAFESGPSQFPTLTKAQDRVKDLNQTAKDATAEMNKLLQELNYNPYADKSKKQAKDVKTIADVTKEYGLELDNIGAKLTYGVISPSEAANERLNILKKTISTLITDFKQTPDKSSLLQGMMDDAGMLNSVIDITKRKLGEVAFSPRDTGPTLDGLDIKPGQQLAERAIKWAQQVQSALRAGVTYVFKDGQKIPLSVAVDPESLDKAADDLAKLKTLIISMVEDGVGQIGETLGGIVANMENPFSGLLTFLGQALKEFGKYLIQIGGLREIIEKAIQSLNLTGVGAIAAGIGAVALGTYLQSQAQKRSRRAFADGGVVYGPTNALIGEYAGASSNPEVVAPLNKLREIIGNTGTQVFIAENRIEGKDIVTVYKRAERFNDR